MKDLLKDILLLVKWSTVSTEYFGKSRTWIYQRISNYDVNGKPAEFSAADKAQLADALRDVAQRILSAADSLSSESDKTITEELHSVVVA